MHRTLSRRVGWVRMGCIREGRVWVVYWGVTLVVGDGVVGLQVTERRRHLRDVPCAWAGGDMGCGEVVDKVCGTDDVVSLVGEGGAGEVFADVALVSNVAWEGAVAAAAHGSSGPHDVESAVRTR